MIGTILKSCKSSPDKFKGSDQYVRVVDDTGNTNTMVQTPFSSELYSLGEVCDTKIAHYEGYPMSERESRLHDELVVMGTTGHIAGCTEVPKG